MLKEKEHIDELFAERLFDFEEKAPSYIWNNIQDDLNKVKRNRRLNYIRAIAASITLLITFGLGYYISNSTLKEKYEAKYLKGFNQQIETSRIPLTENNPNSGIDDSILSEVAEKKHKEIISKKHIENSIEDKNLLFRLFNSTDNNFFAEENESDKTNHIAQNSENSEEKTPNQLLIDTLLIEKENLHKGGFLFENPKQKKSRWSFGTKFSPIYTMAQNNAPSQTNEPVAYSKSSTAVKSETPNTDAKNKSMTSYSGGVNVNYNLSKRISLESGLYYMQRKELSQNLVGSSYGGFEEMTIYTPEGSRMIQPNIEDIAQNNMEAIGGSRGATYYSSDLDYISNFKYIELPILVRYKIIDRKLGLDVLSGFSTNFLIDNNTSIVQDKNSLYSGEIDEVSPLLYNATFGLGLNYNFHKNLSFNIEPTFKYFIQSESDAQLTRYPYSLAVFAGFSFRFK